MVRYTTTPWRTDNDLLAVRTQLYGRNAQNPASPEFQRQAISRILAWKQRNTNLPHAVESTALLIDAILHQHSSDASSIKLSDFSIRAVYTAAFTRFVTGFCDIGRARSGRLGGIENQSSMLEIARQIGMPTEFVALRHEATHEELPSVARLRKAVNRALEWLWEYYWKRLTEGDGQAVDVVVDEATKDEVRKAVKAYRKARREALSKKKRSGDLLAEGEAMIASDELRAICRGGRAGEEAVAQILAGDKFLIPSNRE
jgi:ribosomal biogenesis protein LAS1